MTPRRVRVVAGRELREGLRNRTFLLGAVLTPGFLVVSLLIPAGLDRRLKPAEIGVAVAGAGDALWRELAPQVDAYNARPDTRPRCRLERLPDPPESSGTLPESLQARLRQGDLAGVLVASPGVLRGEGASVLHVHPAGLSKVPRELSRWFGDAARKARLKSLGVRPEAIALFDAPVRIDTRVADEAGVATPAAMLARLIVPIGTVLLLFMGIFSVSQLCLTNLIEERSGRILEVLLASASPLELMAGKILGNGLLGLTVCALWGTVAVFAARTYGLGGQVPPAQLAYLLAYFVLGFLLYAALYCAAGSVCETAQEAQALMLPLTLVAALPLVMASSIVQNPSMPLARALALFPPMTPFVMMLRVAVPPGPAPWETALSFVALASGVWGATWAAARIFRVGILMHGKSSRPAEVWRWLRTR